MGYLNPMNPHTPTGMPLIHDIHGEAYKVTKAVYMALPFLWERLGTIYGAVASNVFVKGTTAIATTEGQVQVIPFPSNISVKQVADSTCWVATKDGTRKYKYQNSYLTEQGLVLRLDHQAPENQKGMPFVWCISLSNKPFGHGPHPEGFFDMPFNSMPPFNLPPAHVYQAQPPVGREWMPPHPGANYFPWNQMPPPPPNGEMPCPCPPFPQFPPQSGDNPPSPPTPPSWGNLI